MPTFGSLFAGIGGIDLGLERAGWTGRWQVEYEPFCQRVLAKHWPDVTRYGDIHDVDWTEVERVDLVAGGFPCQPWSTAGQRRGLDDDRWLWPEFARCLRDLRPRYVLVENVPGLLVGGGMDAILGDLADLGYDAEWESIPAAALGAPHLRYRVWIVAHDDRRHGRASRSDQAQARATGHPLDGGLSDAAIGTIADADLKRCEGQRSGGVLDDLGAAFGHNADGCRGSMAHAASSGRNGASTPESGEHRRERARTPGGRRGIVPGQSDWWRVEPDVGRVAHGVPARVDRLRSLGNAVVPQVVEFIGRRILEAEGGVTSPL